MNATLTSTSPRPAATARSGAARADGTLTHVAIVPAKRHSSRCPDKNWRPFADGLSLVDYTLRTIPRARFSRIIVSTDFDDYRPPSDCERHLRSRHLATVESDVNETVRAIIEAWQLHDAVIWLLNPTSPFRDAAEFDAIARLIEQDECPAVVSVAPVGPFVWRGDTPQFSRGGKRPNTQDCADEFAVENGAFYVFRADEYLRHGSWYPPGVRRCVQRDVMSSVDIDTPEDFERAARLARRRGGDDLLRRETLAVEQLITPPVAEHTVLLANHFGRYVQAMEDLRIGGGDSVLDASTGVGYGAFLLARRAARVVGVDVTEAYLAEARRHYVAANLEFQHLESLKRSRQGWADKLICIETYEHVPPADLPRFIEIVLAALRSGGDAYFTCPLGADGPSHVNPFHLNEPRLQTLHEMLAPRFGDATYRVTSRRDSFGQTGAYCRVLLTGYNGATS